MVRAVNEPCPAFTELKGSRDPSSLEKIWTSYAMGIHPHFSQGWLGIWQGGQFSAVYHQPAKVRSTPSVSHLVREELGLCSCSKEHLEQIGKREKVRIWNKFMGTNPHHSMMPLEVQK